MKDNDSNSETPLTVPAPFREGLKAIKDGWHHELGCAFGALTCFSDKDGSGD